MRLFGKVAEFSAAFALFVLVVVTIWSGIYALFHRPTASMDRRNVGNADDLGGDVRWSGGGT